MRKLDNLIKLLNLLTILLKKMIYWGAAINHVNVNHNHDRNTEMILSDGSALKNELSNYTSSETKSLPCDGQQPWGEGAKETLLYGFYVPLT